MGKKGGHGRSAAVAVVKLAVDKKISLKEANEHLLNLRRVRKTMYEQKNVQEAYRKLREN